MATDRQYNKDREDAFSEIQKAIGEKITELAYWSQDFVKDKKDGLILPDHVKLTEVFRWPASMSYATSDLKDGKKDLKEVFSKVSGRYEGKPQQVIGLADDFVRSSQAKLDGRQSAFEDMYKLLEVAERDFDLTYKPLSKDMLDYWHKKHPIEPQHLEYAYRENQRHFMKESINEMRKFLGEVQAGTFKAKPAPNAAPKAPTP